MEKNKNIVIIILSVVITILFVLCLLFATGTINLKLKDTANNNKRQATENTNGNEQENIGIEENNNQQESIGMDEIKEIFKIVYNYYELPKVYCGKSENNTVNIYGAQRYASTEFTTYEEMLNSLKKYMSLEVIAGKTPWAATTREYYLEMDGKLYCEETYKSYIYTLSNLEVAIVSQTDNRINCVVTTELTDPSDDKSYGKVNVVLEKIKGDWIVTSYEEQ